MDTEKILHEYLRQALKESTEEVAEYARQHHGFISRTGNLESNIVSALNARDLKGWVTIDRRHAPYGVYVHQGYGAFIIVPRNKKALRWFSSADKPIFAKRVRHPGFKGDPFLFNALDTKKDDVFKIFENRVEAALQEITKGL